MEVVEAGIWTLGRCATCGPVNCRFLSGYHTSGHKPRAAVRLELKAESARDR